MDPKDFTKCFLAALNEPNVNEKLGILIGDRVREEVRQLHAVLEKKDAEITQLNNKIDDLELKLDIAEQYSRRNCIRIAGLPESEDEDTTRVTMELINDTMALDPPLELQEVDRLHRVGKPDSQKPRGIIVKFATYRSRARVFNAKAALSGKLFGPAQKKVFINDDLTRQRSKLLYEARQLKKKRLIQDAWTREGTVLIMDKFKKTTPLKSIKDLEKYSRSYADASHSQSDPADHSSSTELPAK